MLELDAVRHVGALCEDIRAGMVESGRFPVKPARALRAGPFHAMDGLECRGSSPLDSRFRGNDGSGRGDDGGGHVLPAHAGPRESGGGNPVIPAQAGIHLIQWHPHRRRRSGQHEMTPGRTVAVAGRTAAVAGGHVLPAHAGPRESGSGNPVIPAQAGIHLIQWHPHRRRRSGQHEMTPGRTVAVAGRTAAVAGGHVLPAHAGPRESGGGNPVIPAKAGIHLIQWHPHRRRRSGQHEMTPGRTVAVAGRTAAVAGGHVLPAHAGPRESGGGNPVIPAQAGIHVGPWHPHRRRRCGQHEMTPGRDDGLV